MQFTYLQCGSHSVLARARSPLSLSLPLLSLPTSRKSPSLLPSSPMQPPPSSWPLRQLARFLDWKIQLYSENEPRDNGIKKPVVQGPFVRHCLPFPCLLSSHKRRKKVSQLQQRQHGAKNKSSVSDFGSEYSVETYYESQRVKND